MEKSNEKLSQNAFLVPEAIFWTSLARRHYCFQVMGWPKFEFCQRDDTFWRGVFLSGTFKFPLKTIDQRQFDVKNDDFRDF